MKKSLLVVFVFILCSSFLLSFEYIVDKNPKRTFGLPFESGDTQITSLTSGTWLDGYYDLTLPTTHQFYFYGRLVTHLRITTKGYVILGFGSAPSGGIDNSNEHMPNPAAPNGIVAALWDDYDLRTTGTLWYKLYNLAGYYYTVVEWRGVPENGVPSTAYTFSVVFTNAAHQTVPDSILFYYSNVVSGNAGSDHGASATVGVEHPTGLQGEEVSYNTASVNNGDVYLFEPFVPVYGSTAFSVPGDPDLLIFRPSDGNWYYRYHAGSTSAFHFGQNLDIPLPGDYDGNLDADECVYRPSDSHWYGNAPTFDIQYGQSLDIPVPADYDGDGKQEIAVFRPGEGRWYIRWWTGASSVYSWGAPGDIPLAGDIDGDGKADLVVWRPSNGVFYGYSPWTSATNVRQWGSGAAGDIPNLGANGGGFNGEPLVFRPSEGTWYPAQWSIYFGVWPWGQDGDVPMPVDWLGFGYTWFMIFRPADGNWYQEESTTINVFPWGTLGDKPRCKRSNLQALSNGASPTPTVQ